MITFREFSKTFGGRTAVWDLSMTIEGEVSGVSACQPRRMRM